MSDFGAPFSRKGGGVPVFCPICGKKRLFWLSGVGVWLCLKCYKVSTIIVHVDKDVDKLREISKEVKE